MDYSEKIQKVIDVLTELELDGLFIIGDTDKNVSVLKSQDEENLFNIILHMFLEDIDCRNWLKGMIHVAETEEHKINKHKNKTS